MASEELQAENRKLVELNLFKAQGAAPQQAETDAFQCGTSLAFVVVRFLTEYNEERSIDMLLVMLGKCKQRRTMYYQVHRIFDISPIFRRGSFADALVSSFRCRQGRQMNR